MSRNRVGRLCLVVVIAAALAGCDRSSPGASSTPTSTDAAVSAEASTPALPPALPSAGESTPAPAPTPAPTATPSALDDLAEFLDAARALDARLHIAAPLVSASIHADSVVIDAPTAAAVKALKSQTLVATIPAGMPKALLLPVLTTYSDLISRSYAMMSFGTPGTRTRIAEEGSMGLAEGEDMYRCLANGSPAAARFEADLATVVATARSLPPLAHVGRADVASAEIKAILANIDLRNGGCAGCGGYVATTVPSVTWDDSSSATARTGTVRAAGDPGEPAEELPFDATYAPDTGWSINLHAC